MTIYEKLLEVQKEIGAIKKDATNPFFRSKYFDINTLLEQIKPVLNKHGLVVLQGLTNLSGPQGDQSVLALETQIIDAESGKVISATCPLPNTVDAQKSGSVITYFRRYALQSLLALEAEDDDGNIATQEKVVLPTKADFNL